MIINYNPYQWKSVVIHTTCPFHQKHPFKKYAGCTCTGNYTIIHEPDWENLMDNVFEEYDEVFKRLADV